jgi:ribonuclease HI
MEQLDDDALSIYTDGSMKERPRRGGYAWLFVSTGEDGHEVVEEFSPNGVPQANNQEMELKAVVEGLKQAERSEYLAPGALQKINILTDSTFVHDHFATAKFKWTKTGFKRATGPPVMHTDLWRELVRVLKRLDAQHIRVDIEWVPGKSSPHTKRVDKLARDSAERPFARPSPGRTVRRKQSEESTQPGSVPMDGQELEIKIIEAKYESRHRLWRYRYRVLSEGLPYTGKIDFIWSAEPLRTRDVHLVRLNDDPKFPQIEDFLDEAVEAR